MSTLIKSDTLAATGEYVFPELPRDHFWVYGHGFGFAFGKLAIMKPGLLFSRTVNSKSLAFFYAETKEDGLRPYEPGNHLYQSAMRLRYDTFPRLYPDARESDVYISGLRKGAGTETILEEVYALNFGKHQGGDAIYHYAP